MFGEWDLSYAMGTLEAIFSALAAKPPSEPFSGRLMYLLTIVAKMLKEEHL